MLADVDLSSGPSPTAVATALVVAFFLALGVLSFWVTLRADRGRR